MDTEEQLREQTKATECIFGLVGNGLAIVAADASTGYKLAGSDTTMDKIMVFDSHKLIGAIGHCADSDDTLSRLFTKHIKKQARSFKGTPLTTADTATFIHHELAATMRSFRVNMLLAGYDEETGPSLYHIDCTASPNKVEKGAFGGDGSSYSLSVMDSSFHSGMSLGEAIELVDACIEEIRSSLDVGSPTHIIKIVDEQGARLYAWRKPRSA